MLDGPRRLPTCPDVTRLNEHILTCESNTKTLFQHMGFKADTYLANKFSLAKKPVFLTYFQTTDLEGVCILSKLFIEKCPK